MSDTSSGLFGDKFLKRYEIRSRLGGGGMGEVFLGWDRVREREVALKVLRPPDPMGGNQDDDEVTVKRFTREARLLGALHHRNIVEYLETTQDGRRTVLVMEYVPGLELDKAVQASDQPLLAAVRYVVQVSEALDAAHRLGIVHRDMKPENIRVRPDGTVKVMDFGLARQLESNSITRLTKTEMILGTPVYMAPEQAMGAGDPTDPQYAERMKKCDLYSLGVIMYELLAGRPPFMEKSAVELIMRHLGTLPEPVQNVNREIPPALGAIVMRLLEKNPDDRFESALAVRDAVLGVASSVWGTEALGLVGDPLSGATAQAGDAPGTLAAPGAVAQGGGSPERTLGRGDTSGSRERPMHRLVGRERELIVFQQMLQAIGAFRTSLVSSAASVRGTGGAAPTLVTRSSDRAGQGAPPPSGSGAPAPRARAALLLGDTGIGKTRLTREVTARASAGSVRVLQAAGRAEALPLAPIARLVEQVRQRYPDLYREAVEGTGSPLAALTQRGASEESAETGRDRNATAQKWALFEALADLVGRVCNLRPVLIFLDDAEKADSTSLEALEHLVESLAEKPILVVAAFDTSDSQARDVASGFARRVRRHLGADHARELRLEPLDSLQVKELAAQVLGHAMRNEDASAVETRTGGNPLILLEVLEHLTARGLTRLHDDTLELTAGWESEVPESLQKMMLDRVRRLGDRPMLVLTAAAALAGRFDMELLQTACRVLDRGIDEDEISAIVDQALEQRLLREEWSAAAEEFDFTDLLLRDALYEKEPERRRRRLHEAVARHLEDGGADAARIAHHMRLAGDRQKAVEHYRRAAMQAEALFARPEALSHWQWVVRLLKEQGGAADPEALAEALLEAGYLCGVMKRPAEARQAYEEAVAVAEECHDAFWRIRTGRRLGSALYQEGQHSNAVIALNEVLEGAPGDTSDRSRIEQGWCHDILATIAWQQGQSENAFRHLELAEASVAHLASSRELTELLVDVSSCRGLLHYDHGDKEQAEAAHRLSVNLSSPLGPTAYGMLALNNLGLVYTDLMHRYDEAVVQFEQALVIARQLHLTHWIASIRSNRALAYRALGRWTETLDELQAVLPALEDRPSHQTAVQINLSEALYERGDILEAARMARAALDEAIRLGERPFECEARYRLAVAVRELGHGDEARSLLFEADELARENGFEAQRPAVLAALTGLVPLEEATLHIEEAVQVVNRLSDPAARSLLLRTQADIERRGHRDSTPESAGRAEGLLREAADLSRSIHRPFEEAQALASLGELLVGFPERRREGIELLEQGMATFVRLGAHREATRIEGIFSRLADTLPGEAHPA